MINVIDNNKNSKFYNPSEEERDFIAKVYSDFLKDKQIKDQAYDLLSGRTLQQFWDDSNYDYNNVIFDDPSDPIKSYSSGITRDKSNSFVQRLTLQLLVPSVTAQNPNQEIDQIVSRVSRSVLEWQYNNDGRPAESGAVKNVRYTHRQVTEGTSHVQDDMDPDTGRMVSSGIPNEEVFVPNFKQPNVQLQSHFIRHTEYESFQEAEAEFQDLAQFDYVAPGNIGWLTQVPKFKEATKMIVKDNQVSVTRCWYPVATKDLEKFKAQGKLPKYAKKAKYFNIIINGVLMFPVENLLPYHDGDYPISKGIFEHFSPPEFYWGNSMPNKCRQDKLYLDGWKTLVRYKAKLAAIPPLLNFTGQHIDGDVMVPGKMTDFPANFDPSKISTIEGISGGITSGDIEVIRDTTEDIDRATAAPQTTGQTQTKGQQTLGEIAIIEEHAKEAMMGFAQQIGFLQEARAFPIIKRSYQFLTRQDIKKIAVPSQVFQDGTAGTLEVIFEKLPPMTDAQKEKASFMIKEHQDQAKKENNPKQVVYVDPEYVQELDFYCKATADSLPRDLRSIKEAKAKDKFATYSQRPDLFNVKQSARVLVRELGDDESQMINDTPAIDPNAQQMPGAKVPGASAVPAPAAPGAPKIPNFLSK